MSLIEFVATQDANAENLRRTQHFTSLVPLVERMYEAARILASKHSPTLGTLFLSCHREFLVAASLIQRGFAKDSHANSRRAIEAAKVALALKLDANSGGLWLKHREERWQARKLGIKPKWLPPVKFEVLKNEPLIESLQEYYGIASDVYIHFTPEFFGQQDVSETPSSDDSTVFVGLKFLASERDILWTITLLCGLHVQILLVFDKVFDNGLIGDKAWAVLRATFDQLFRELQHALPPQEGGGLSNAGF